MQEHTERLGSAPLPSLLLRLSLPSIAAALTMCLYNIVDTMWVGRLGHEAIAALTIVFPYQILAIAVGIGTGVGISALVSRRFGEKDIEATNRTGGQVFFISAFWGLFFILIANFFGRPILHAFGATPDIMDMAMQYITITAYGAPAHVFILTAGNLIRGSGDAVKPMVMMIAGSLLNVILDPFLILGIGPFPAMGVSGAALATVIAQSIGMCIGLYYLVARRTGFHIRLSHLAPNLRLIADIYRVGAPASIQEITESLAFVLFNRVLSGYGSVAIASIGVVLRVSDLAFMPVIGMASALLPVVGFNLGAGNEKRLWSAVRLSTLGLMALLAVVTVIYEVFAPQIAGIFIHDSEVIKTTIEAMRIGLATTVFIGPTILFVTTFQGLSKGTMALFLSLIRQFLIFVPILYLFNHLWGLTGVWCTNPATDTTSLVITLLFIVREYRNRQRERTPLMQVQ